MSQGIFKISIHPFSLPIFLSAVGRNQLIPGTVKWNGTPVSVCKQGNGLLPNALQYNRAVVMQ